MTVRYSPIRHRESNPVERVMREIGKYCKIYCHTTQNKWPERIPKIESWLNTTISGSTGFTPVDLMFNDIRPDIFSKILNKKYIYLKNMLFGDNSRIERNISDCN